MIMIKGMHVQTCVQMLICYLCMRVRYATAMLINFTLR